MYLMVRWRRGWTRGTDSDSGIGVGIGTGGDVVVILVNRDDKGRCTRWQFVYWPDRVLRPSCWVILAFRRRRLLGSRAGRVHHWLYAMDRVGGLYDLRHPALHSRTDVPDHCLRTSRYRQLLDQRRVDRYRAMRD